MSSTCVNTAVEFLRDVSKKDFNEKELKRYLLEKQGLTIDQVNEAFQIHRALSKTKSKEMLSTKLNSNETNTESILERWKRIKITKTAKPSTKDVRRSRWAYLLPSRQADGEKLRSDFLESERNYCKVLECLKEDYYRKLVNFANEQKIDITTKQVSGMFQYIPKLLKAHRIFFTDLMLGSDIGSVFIQRLGFFKGYGPYMKDCVKAIYLMREHIYDTKFQKCLTEIRKSSRCGEFDLSELLLKPLGRIWEYQEFLEQVCCIVDRNRKEDYVFLDKATRRIGRLANYIEQYRHGIINKNEMNKVQQYLGRQCSIIVPQRRIIRRGMIIRRTTTWPPRNKNYYLFLFNDLLLWTTEQGELQNIVRVQNCELQPSDSKTNPEQKFKIVINMERNIYKNNQKQKTLLLACNSERQRNEWYEATKQAIEEQRNIAGKDNQISDQNYSLQFDSDDEEFEMKNKEAIAESIDKGVEIDSCASEKINRDYGSKREIDEDKDARVKPDTTEHSMKHRYKMSANFNQMLKEFNFDDGESWLADYENSFNDNLTLQHDFDSSSLRPCTIYEDGVQSFNSVSPSIRFMINSGELGTNRSVRSLEPSEILPTLPENEQKEDGVDEEILTPIFNKKSPSFKIRRSEPNIIGELVTSKTYSGFQRRSSYTVLLNDQRLENEPSHILQDNAVLKFSLDGIQSV